MTKTLQVQPNINQQKIEADIKFIDSISSWCREQNWRLVVYGGYGLDGYLQTVTRNHGDIDIVIYGLSPRSVALAAIVTYLNKALDGVEITSKDEDFLIDIKVKSQSISGNFYYVKTAEDPYQNLNSVVKLDGTQITNSPADFPPPVPGKLGDYVIEVQDQSAHLKDILRKRNEVNVLTKHDQDIENIQASLTAP